MFSNQRRIEEIVVNFKESDFYHLAGLQYITDVAIPRDRKKILSYLANQKITKEQLQKSYHYDNKRKHYNVKSRLESLQYLEEYLDTDNQIKIFSLDNEPFLKTKIQADYLIESRLPNQMKTMYIFLGKRKEEPGIWCVVSIFEKQNKIYKGKKLYWMLKEKRHPSRAMQQLYKHPNYDLDKQ